MEITKEAVAGTLESSDVMIRVEPAPDGIALDIVSSVANQYGAQIKSVVLDTIQKLGVTSAKVTVVDKGALDCTLKARVQCAVYRAAGLAEKAENIPWGVL